MIPRIVCARHIPKSFATGSVISVVKRSYVAKPKRLYKANQRILQPYDYLTAGSTPPDFEFHTTEDEANKFLRRHHQLGDPVTVYVDWEEPEHGTRRTADIVALAGAGLAGKGWISVSRVRRMRTFPASVRQILWDQKTPKWTHSLYYAHVLAEDFGMPENIDPWNDLLYCAERDIEALPKHWRDINPGHYTFYGVKGDMAAIIAILEGKELELRSRGVHDWADREPWEADKRYVANICSAQQTLLRHIFSSWTPARMQHHLGMSRFHPRTADRLIDFSHFKKGGLSGEGWTDKLFRWLKQRSMIELDELDEEQLADEGRE